MFFDNLMVINIPYFLVNGFKNDPRLSGLITPEEELVLKYIENIEIKHFFITKMDFVSQFISTRILILPIKL